MIIKLIEEIRVSLLSWSILLILSSKLMGAEEQIAN